MTDIHSAFSVSSFFLSIVILLRSSHVSPHTSSLPNTDIPQLSASANFYTVVSGEESKTGAGTPYQDYLKRTIHSDHLRTSARSGGSDTSGRGHTLKHRDVYEGFVMSLMFDAPVFYPSASKGGALNSISNVSSSENACLYGSFRMVCGEALYDSLPEQGSTTSTSIPSFLAPIHGSSSRHSIRGLFSQAVGGSVFFRYIYIYSCFVVTSCVCFFFPPSFPYCLLHTSLAPLSHKYSYTYTPHTLHRSNVEENEVRLLLLSSFTSGGKVTRVHDRSDLEKQLASGCRIYVSSPSTTALSSVESQCGSNPGLKYANGEAVRKVFEVRSGSTRYTEAHDPVNSHNIPSPVTLYRYNTHAATHCKTAVRSASRASRIVAALRGDDALIGEVDLAHTTDEFKKHSKIQSPIAVFLELDAKEELGVEVLDKTEDKARMFAVMQALSTLSVVDELDAQGGPFDLMSEPIVQGAVPLVVQAAIKAAKSAVIGKVYDFDIGLRSHCW